MNTFKSLLMAGVTMGYVSIAQAAVGSGQDVQLTTDAQASLNQIVAFHADGLQVEVIDGVAYVHGQASTSAESLDAAEIVAHTPGITRVVDLTYTPN